MKFIRAQIDSMANLKKKTDALIKNLKKIEDKQIALRAAVKKQDARLDASQNALRVVEQAIGGKLIAPGTKSV